MADLTFAVEGVRAQPFAASPQLLFALRVTNRPASDTVQSIVLRCQIQMEVTRRLYTPAEKERLHDLFGEPDRWPETLKAMHWTTVTAVVPPFEGAIEMDLAVPATFDFNVAATKYFHGIEDGEVPLAFLFSGTVFQQGPSGALQVAQVPWEKEAAFRMPVRAWKEMIDLYYPNTAWLCLRRDVFDRLSRFKTGSGLLTWEQAFEKMLQAEEGAHSWTSTRSSG